MRRGESAVLADGFMALARDNFTLAQGSIYSGCDGVGLSEVDRLAGGTGYAVFRAGQLVARMESRVEGSRL